MVTHICLLSEQPTPNVCPLLDRTLRANEVVFVVSPQQKDKLRHLEPVLARHQIRINELPIEQPYAGVEAIQQAIETEIQRQRRLGRTVFVNATGGTKPMSIAAHMAAFNHDASVFYVHDDRVEWLYQPSGAPRASLELEERMKLPDFLQAHGIEYCKAGMNVPPGADALLQDLLGSPRAYAQGIRALNYHAARAQGTLRSPLDAGHQDHAALQATLDKFAEHDLLEARRGAIAFASEEARFFCAGGWLEHHALRTLSDMRGELGRKLNDLQGSVQVKSLEKRSAPVRNEIDVAVLYNNRLHIIECKTRVFDDKGQPANADGAATDALYKLATLKRELGGIRAQAMLLSYQPVQPWHRERAKLLDIELVAADELRALPSRLKAWLGHPAATTTAPSLAQAAT